MVLGSVGALLPWGSIPQFVVGGVVVAVVAGAYLSLPAWLIALSNVMDRHTAAWGEPSLQAALTEGRPRQTGALSR